MNDLTHYQRHENIAVITLDKPPVNSLSQAMRQALFTDYKKALADVEVEGIVIVSSGKVFCGGADITEFAGGGFNSEPTLDTVFELEESSKPIVAAINAAALGGGLELALACDYRMAKHSAILGLPEVNLGIIPGAGGTQRLPRLTGPRFALEMISSGRSVTAKTALKSGLVDHLHEGDGDFIEAAINYTKELVVSGAPVRSCTSMEVDSSELTATFFDDFRKSIARRTRGFFAPECCIQAVQAACELPLAEGLKREKALFEKCLLTSQARAQKHLFFAERAATKVPGMGFDTSKRNIDRVAIIGAGTMGGGIAMNFANMGIPVCILETNAQALDRGLDTIRTNYAISQKRGKLTESQLKERMKMISSTLDYEDLCDADLVIEAVFESMQVKKEVFKHLDKVCKPGAILATNTSTLNVNEIAEMTSRPQDVIGLHFFSPANVMRLLEIVRADKTAGDVVVTTIDIAKRIGKVPVVVGVCWGFVGNRVLEPYGRESTRLVLEGASPAQVDGALNNFGMAMGFLSMIDMAGIDVGYLTRQGNKAAFDHDPSYQVICSELYAMQRYGRKSGRGFYQYAGRDQIEDPEVEEIAQQCAAKLGVTRRSEISEQEIVERTIYMLINEAAKCLEEGIAARSSDIDLIFANGYGFPAWRGGPLQYADEIGLDLVLSAINRYRTDLGEHGEKWFKPAPLLESLAASGKTFNSFQRHQ